MNEVDYENGKRRALLSVLGHVLRELGVDDPAASGARWVLERQEAVAMLRDLCAEHGDNDWPDDLHLGDVIEKHLGRYLTEA